MNLPRVFLNNLFVIKLTKKIRYGIAGLAPLEILNNFWFSIRSRRKSVALHFVFNKKTSAGSLTGFTPLEIYTLLKRIRKTIFGHFSKLFRLLRSASLTGFTLIEFLIVTGLIILLAGLFLPIGFGFYRTQSVDEAREDIITILRRAQNQALFQKNDSSFGIKFLSNSYVLFQGDSYAARQQNEDEIFIIPSGITITGLGEVVFNKFTGVPDVAGTVSASSGSYTKVIDINSQGKIEGL